MEAEAGVLFITWAQAYLFLRCAHVLQPGRQALSLLRMGKGQKGCASRRGPGNGPFASIFKTRPLLWRPRNAAGGQPTARS